MQAKRVPFPIASIASGRVLHCPVAVGSAQDYAGVSVAVNAAPAESPLAGSRVTIALSTPAGSLVAWLSLDELDVLDDQLRAARADMIAATAPEVQRG